MWLNVCKVFQPEDTYDSGSTARKSGVMKLQVKKITNFTKLLMVILTFQSLPSVSHALPSSISGSTLAYLIKSQHHYAIYRESEIDLYRCSRFYSESRAVTPANLYEELFGRLAGNGPRILTSSFYLVNAPHRLFAHFILNQGGTDLSQFILLSGSNPKTSVPAHEVNPHTLRKILIPRRRWLGRVRKDIGANDSFSAHFTQQGQAIVHYSSYSKRNLTQQRFYSLCIAIDEGKELLELDQQQQDNYIGQLPERFNRFLGGLSYPSGLVIQSNVGDTLAQVFAEGQYQFTTGGSLILAKFLANLIARQPKAQLNSFSMTLAMAEISAWLSGKTTLLIPDHKHFSTGDLKAFASLPVQQRQAICSDSNAEPSSLCQYVREVEKAITKQEIFRTLPPDEA